MVVKTKTRSKKSKQSNMKDITVSGLKKKVLDLKDDLQKSSREIKFLKESLKNIKAPSSPKKGILEKTKEALKNSSTKQKIATVIGGTTTVAVIAKLVSLAKDELNRRKVNQSIASQILPDTEIIMENVSAPPSPKFQLSQKESMLDKIGNLLSGNKDKPILM
jgi:hypothetical protein